MYNGFLQLIDKDKVNIKEDEYLLLSNIEFISDSFKKHYESKEPITINDKKLIPSSEKIVNQALENYSSPGNDGVIVISDENINGLDLLNVSIVGNFNKSEEAEKIQSDFYDFLCLNIGTSFNYRSRVDMFSSSLGLRTMVIFIGLYLGITFAISSATILAIGQLSESSDNKKRYKIIRQLGSDEQMINKALFNQTAITFMFPLVIALIHSYFGLREINRLLISIGNIDLTSSILLTTLFMIVVYGGYFLITYLCSKRLIKE